MWLVVFGLVLGMTIGFFTPVSVPMELSKYLAVALLAGLDSSLGGLRAGFEKKFRLSIFTSGFVFNIFMAALLVYLGDLLGIDLYLAAIVVFGMRIFNNITAIRRMLIDKFWIIPKSTKAKIILEENKTQAPIQSNIEIKNQTTLQSNLEVKQLN